MRLFFLGGWLSYRALFGWLSPWILIPTFLLDPIFQMMFFVFVGRSAGVGSDEFFLIGNSIVAVAIPCLFATGNTIEGERNSQTLGLLLSSPARRMPLFLGRSLPVIVNGFVVSMVALFVGSRLLDVPLAAASIPAVTFIIVISAYSCTGLGLVAAALALRVRETAVMSNIVLGILLVFCGVNIPLSSLPAWMSVVALKLPLTHGIAAARGILAGESWANVSQLVLAEFVVGTVYIVLGMLMLSYLEAESRRHATLERA